MPVTRNIEGEEFNEPTPFQRLLATAAYERYGAVTDFKNFRGEPMPTFEQLPPKIQIAWAAVGDAGFIARPNNRPPEL